LLSRHEHFTLRNVMLISRAEHLQGSVPEIVIHGKTGFVVDTIDDMAEAVRSIHNINPDYCRNHIKRKFLNCQYGRKIFTAVSVDCRRKDFIPCLKTFQ